MKLIVGLGNPGKQYIFTPHNIGWIALDTLSRYWGVKWNFKKKFSAEIALTEQKYLLVKPQTYMNLSGIAIKSIMHYYHLNINNLLVIHDDIDLPFLSIRFQKNRGAAGHNGLKNINQELGSQNYTRLRIGMKPPNLSPTLTTTTPKNISVLKPFTKTQTDLLPNFLNTIIDVTEYYIKEGLNKTANNFNS